MTTININFNDNILEQVRIIQNHLVEFGQDYDKTNTYNKLTLNPCILSVLTGNVPRYLNTQLAVSSIGEFQVKLSEPFATKRQIAFHLQVDQHLINAIRASHAAPVADKLSILEFDRQVTTEAVADWNTFLKGLRPRVLGDCDPTNLQLSDEEEKLYLFPSDNLLTSQWRLPGWLTTKEQELLQTRDARTGPQIRNGPALDPANDPVDLRRRLAAAEARIQQLDTGN